MGPVPGAVKQALTLTADDLAKMPRASVRTTNNGTETIYDGVWLHEVLKKVAWRLGLPLKTLVWISFRSMTSVTIS
jgi:hypothetical protein